MHSAAAKILQTSVVAINSYRVLIKLTSHAAAQCQQTAVQEDQYYRRHLSAGIVVESQMSFFYPGSTVRFKV